MSWRDFAIALLAALIADEMLGWVEHLGRWLIRSSARHAPPSLVPRLEEEWLAHFEQLQGKLRRFWFALDSSRASYLISHEFYLPHVSALISLKLRIMDILAAVGLLVLSAPTLLIAMVAIKVEDGWRAPIFARFDRVGRGGRPFLMLKFRTNRRSVDTFESKLTRVGRVIRKLRVDELPTVLNILLGHMSFVGPAPKSPVLQILLEEKMPHYARRWAVKPGITGWAQLNDDPKGSLSRDIYYIEHMVSVRGYIKILVRTALLVFF